MVSSEEDVGSEGEVDYSKVVKEIEDMDMPNTIITKLIGNAVSTIYMRAVLTNHACLFIYLQQITKID